MSLIYVPKGRAREYAPLGLNLTEGICPHGCRYDGEMCYANRLWTRFHADRADLPLTPKPDVLEHLEKEAAKLAGDPRPIHMSFTGDCYPVGRPDLWALTREALTILRAHGLHWQMLTKGGLAACEDLDLYRPGDWFGVTLTNFTGWVQEQWEPNAAPTYERMDALSEARNQGISTWVSAEPILRPRDIIWGIVNMSKVDLWRIGIAKPPLPGLIVDWPQFGRDLADVLTETGAHWYIKHTLRPYMPEGFAMSTEEAP